MGDLSNFINQSGDFVRWVDGEPVIGIYKGYRMIPDTFNKGEETVEYTLEIDGKDKTFNSKSVKLASQMNQKKKGDRLQIVKTGAGTATNWYVGEPDKE